MIQDEITKQVVVMIPRVLGEKERKGGTNR
jgi:hypothetical protein